MPSRKAKRTSYVKVCQDFLTQVTEGGGRAVRAPSDTTHQMSDKEQDAAACDLTLMTGRTLARAGRCGGHGTCQGECAAGMSCTSYHIYVRPNTQDIIAKVRYAQQRRHQAMSDLRAWVE